MRTKEVLIRVVFRKFHKNNSSAVSQSRGSAPPLLRALPSALFFPEKRLASVDRKVTFPNILCAHSKERSDSVSR